MTSNDKSVKEGAALLADDAFNSNHLHNTEEHFTG